MNTFALSGLLIFISSLSFGIFSWVKGERFLNKIWAMFNLAVAVWGLGAYKFASALDEKSAFLWLRIGHIGVILIPVLFLHFVFELLETKNKKIIFSVYAIGIAFFILNITDWLGISKLFIVSVRFVFNQFYVDSPPGLIYPAFVAFFFGIVIYAHICALKRFKLLTGQKREQVKYFLLATSLGFSGGGTAFPMVFGIPLYPYLHFTIFLYPIIMTYAIFRYRLMDIRVAVTRTGIFTIVYAVVLGIPFWIGFKLLGRGPWITPISIMAVLATAGPFIYLFLQRKAEDRILREQRHRQEVVIRASETFTLIKRLDRLLRYIGLLVTIGLKIDYAAIFLFDKRNPHYILSHLRGKVTRLVNPAIAPDTALIKYLQHLRGPLLYEEVKEKSLNSNHKNNAAEVESFMHSISSHIIVPSFIKDKLVGFIILGGKTSGEIYTHDDITTFKIMAISAAVAIEYAQFLKEYEEVQGKLREAEKLKGIGQLMYSLNHELLNAFNLILPPVQILLMGIYKDKPEKMDESLKIIEDGINRCMEILGYIKSYRYKSASEELKLRNMEELMNSAVGQFSKRLQEENIQPTIHIQPNLPLIQGKDTLEDLPVNVLANCFFALVEKPREKRFIDINVYLSEDKKNIQIKVSDTGADITKDSDTHDTGSPFKERGKMGGVNLGLAHLITNGHNGTLELKSYEKGGTTFIITLPINQQEVP